MFCRQRESHTPIWVMVREGEPPTTLQLLPEAKEVVGGLPSQTMTADVNLKEHITSALEPSW